MVRDSRSDRWGALNPVMAAFRDPESQAQAFMLVTEIETLAAQFEATLTRYNEPGEIRVLTFIAHLGYPAEVLYSPGGLCEADPILHEKTLKQAIDMGDRMQ